MARFHEGIKKEILRPVNTIYSIFMPLRVLTELCSSYSVGKPGPDNESTRVWRVWVGSSSTHQPEVMLSVVGIDGPAVESKVFGRRTPSLVSKSLAVVCSRCRLSSQSSTLCSLRTAAEHGAGIHDGYSFWWLADTPIANAWRDMNLWQRKHAFLLVPMKSGRGVYSGW